MTTSRDLVTRTLNHEPIDRIPRDLWYSREVELTRPDELAEMEIRYPRDIIRAEFKYPAGRLTKGNPERAGSYTDAWGCTWHVAQRGAEPKIQGHPLASPPNIADYAPPQELLRSDKKYQARLAAVNQQCAATSRFVLAETETRPFDRLRFLCGDEAAVAGLEASSEPIRNLLAMLHDFSCREMEMWAASDVDGVMIRDDWGAEDSLVIDPKIWREVFRPLYREYCRILQTRDKFVFFRTRGNISSIFGDLVRTGVDAIHATLKTMNIERLAKRYRGRVTFWGDIDTEETLSHGSPEQVRETVLQVRRALDFGSGGLIAQCEWGPKVPLQNVISVFEQWALPLPMHA